MMIEILKRLYNGQVIMVGQSGVVQERCLPETSSGQAKNVQCADEKLH
jgi:hypothetical protein